MRSFERNRGLLRAPKIAWDALVRGSYGFVYDGMRLRADRMPAAKRLNLCKAGLNLVHRRLSPWSMPLHMQIELTNYCNLSCPVCPTGTKAVQRAPKAMDPALFERILEEAGPYLLTLSLWAWGEPLLHPRLQEILRLARRHSLVSLLSTNGQNLDNDRVLEAICSEPPACLIVAIDGLTQETHSTYRVNSRLAPILDGVRRLAEIKRRRGLSSPVLQMRFIVMKHNQHEVPRLQEFASAHGFDMLGIRTLCIIDSDRPDHVHGRFVPDDPSLRAYQYEHDTRIPGAGFICQEPFWFPTVFADGTLVACEQDFNAQQSLGVVSEEVSFRSLWYNSHAEEVRRRIRDNSDTLSFCRNCPYCDRPETSCTTEMHWLRAGVEIGTTAEKTALD
jgi:radical SAM protein with 4Fe4S-binding SPASM domain